VLHKLNIRLPVASGKIVVPFRMMAETVSGTSIIVLRTAHTS
jgi:hypothetical protein